MKKLLHQLDDSNCTSDKHNCEETLRKVMLSLDGELSNDAEVLLMADLNRCSWCLNKFEIEQTFKVFLSKKLEKKCCPEDMVKNIKSQIQRLSGNA